TLALSRDPAQRARCAKDLVRLRLESAQSAHDAFSSTRAALKADLGDDPGLSEVAARALLDEATKAWVKTGGGPSGADSDAARAVWETIIELSELHFRAERPERAV